VAFVVAELARRYPNYPADAAAYAEDLADLDGETLIEAARRCRLKLKFFPMVSEIREEYAVVCREQWEASPHRFLTAGPSSIDSACVPCPPELREQIRKLARMAGPSAKPRSLIDQLKHCRRKIADAEAESGLGCS
jgi:hypothetical protein